MKVLVACEFSGVVSSAFRKMGHDAWSCDLLPTEGDRPDRHIVGDVLHVLGDNWDCLIAHPPCTYLANSGAKWLYDGAKKVNGPNTERWFQMGAGAEFFKALWTAPVPRICIENPIMLGYARQHIGSDPTQIIQPWQFGHPETKATCLWLKNLPPLAPTDIVDGREQRVWKEPPGPDRWKKRSLTYSGIADAMATQWSETFLHNKVEPSRDVPEYRRPN